MDSRISSLHLRVYFGKSYSCLKGQSPKAQQTHAYGIPSSKSVEPNKGVRHEPQVPRASKRPLLQILKASGGCGSGSSANGSSGSSGSGGSGSSGSGSSRSGSRGSGNGSSGSLAMVVVVRGNGGSRGSGRGSFRLVRRRSLLFILAGTVSSVFSVFGRYELMRLICF